MITHHFVWDGISGVGGFLDNTNGETAHILVLPKKNGAA